MDHAFGGKEHNGVCIWCGGAFGAVAPCAKHPQAAREPRPAPKSFMDDFDFVRGRAAELAAERAAIRAKPEEET